MRFTALLEPAIITRISSTTTTAGSVRSSKSRMNEMCGEAGVWPRSSGNWQRQHAEHHRDQRLAGELRLAAQAEAALLGDLDVVVEEADRAQPDEQEQQQQRRPRRHVLVISLASEVGERPPRG